jgi:Ca-activated chloride channel homolog
MTLIHLKWIPLIGILVVLFSLYIRKSSNRRNAWVKKYWMCQETRSSKLSRLCTLVAIGILGFALADLRGPEERVTMEVPEKRTVIVIDTSASMLVEDVAPSRFSRSLLLARHFIRATSGELKSIIVFSDQAKRIIPFTYDLDLLDSRLIAVEAMDIQSGGSNISLALSQAVQYLRSETSGAKNTIGSILLITDGEEHGWENTDISIPTGITLAVIGVGTSRGGRIPLRSRDGSFRGYKRDGNEEITSALNEDYFKSLTAGIANSRYWIASSYALPTSEVVDFFNRAFQNAVSDADVRYRPVYGYPLIGIGLALLLLSSLLSFSRQFVIAKAVVFLVIWGGGLIVEETTASEQKTLRATELMELMSRSGLETEDRLELAQELLKSDDYEYAKKLYEEIKNSDGVDAMSTEDFFNLGTAQLMTGKIKEGLETYEKLKKQLKENQESFHQLMRNNVLAALIKQDEMENQEGQQEQESDESEEGDDESDESSADENEDSSSSDGQDDEQGDSEDSKDNEVKNDEEDGDDDDDRDQDNSDEEETQDNENEKESSAQTANDNEVPALIQQIMNDDRDLQQRQLDMSTRDPRRVRGAKDW